MKDRLSARSSESSHQTLQRRKQNLERIKKRETNCRKAKRKKELLVRMTRQRANETAQEEKDKIQLELRDRALMKLCKRQMREKTKYS